MNNFDLISQGVCLPQRTIDCLSDKPNPALNWFDKLVAFFTTPIKRLLPNIFGWKHTGCVASTNVTLVRDAQHSTDGFWTLDVSIDQLNIAEAVAPAGKFIRIEVEKGGKAHDICAQTPLKQGQKVSLSGIILIDADGPFLEIHPKDDFQLIK